MEPNRKSKLYDGIRDAVSAKKLNEPFSVDDVNRNCNNLLSKSAAFLGKHSKGNPGKYSELFIRVSKGKYKLNKD